MFYLRSRGVQVLPLLAPGYAAEIQQGQMYLKEALDHLRNLRLSLFLWDVVCFLFWFIFSVWTYHLLLD